MAEACTTVYASANGCALRDLGNIGDPHRAYVVRYEDFVEDPRQIIESVCEFAELDFDSGLRERISRPLPLTFTVNSKPAPDKWIRKLDKPTIERILPIIEPVTKELGYG